MEALRAYEAEIGIFGSQQDAGDLTMVKIGLSPIIAIAGPTTFSKPPDKIAISALAEFPLIFREQGSETQARVMQAARQAGVNLEAMIIAEGREAVRDLVAGASASVLSPMEIGNDTGSVGSGWRVSPSMRKRWLICQRDVMCRLFAFMRTLVKPDL